MRRVESFGSCSPRVRICWAVEAWTRLPAGAGSGGGFGNQSGIFCASVEVARSNVAMKFIRIFFILDSLRARNARNGRLCAARLLAARGVPPQRAERAGGQFSQRTNFWGIVITWRGDYNARTRMLLSPGSSTPAGAARF